MAVYTLLTNEQIAELVEQRYGLGTLAFAVGIAQGVENSNYLLTVIGENGAEIRYILTLYEKRTRPEELPFFMALMEHLAATGICCPRPIAMNDGSVIGTICGKSFAMVSFLEGKSVTAIRTEHCAQVGAEAAQLHLAASGFAGARANSVAMPAWQQMAASLGEKLDTIQPGLHALVRDELIYLENAWPHGLPEGVVHADMFPDNVFFDTKNQLSGVIDFYFACSDMFAYDLAIVLNAWCFERTGEWNMTKARALINAYTRIRPLSADEILAFPVLARGAALRFLLTRAYDKINAGPQAVGVQHDPIEYVRKLRFHQQITSASGYGLS